MTASSMTNETPAPLTLSWSLAAAVLLPFCGGYGDATGYLLAKTFTGHVTGNLVLLALALPRSHPPQILPRIISVVCFLATTGAGALLNSWNRRRASLIAFLVQATLLLTIVAPRLRHSADFSLLLIIALSLALGLQNGVVTSIDGISLHPTFLSGNFTTLVSTWVKVWRDTPRGGKPQNPAAAPVLLAVIAGFFLGAAAARVLSGMLGDLLPASLLLPFLAATLV